MLKVIKLYGELAEKYGKVWNLEVNSPSEAVRALCANNPGFKEYLATSHERGLGYKVMVGDRYIEQQEEIYDPSGRQEIKIVPVILGAKKEGLGTVLLGIALIVLAPQAIPYLVEAGLSEGMAAAIAGAAVSTGVQLTMGGIAQLLAPTPKEQEDMTEANYGFNGATNTSRQGAAVPICYGQLMIGGAVISSGITSENYNP
jgi:predicted phage tail protein